MTSPLVDLYYGPLYRFALSLTRTETDACDLTQETFRIWATKGHQLQDRTRVKSWLFTNKTYVLAGPEEADLARKYL